MAPCYSKNSILKGTVDYYCLVCETYLRCETDIVDHIAKPIHKKNLDGTQYVKDFEEDSVRKIKMGYFCELCNKLLPMMARVKIHVKEPSHIDNKNILFFKRIGANVIAFGKVVLNERAWNGLNDESCAFCNTEYEDESIHKNLLSHILNIIQIKVEVDEKKNLYRKIDDVSFHCLTCNMVLALNDITSHFEEEQHKHLYQKCCDISLNKINKNELKKNEANIVTEKQSHKINDNLAKSSNNTGENTEEAYTTIISDVNTKCDVLEKTTPTTIKVRPLNELDEKEKQSKITKKSDVEKEFEDSKDCAPNTSDKTPENKEESKVLQDNINKDVDVNIKNKNLAVKKVKKNQNTKKTGTSKDEVKTTRSKNSFNIEKYEKKICKLLKTEDYITLDENGKTLCILCDWIMDPQVKKAHVSGLHHQTMEKMHKKRLAELGDRNNNEITVLQDKSILDLVSKFQANNVTINLIFNTAVCKKCSVNLPYDVNAIEEHIQKHNNETFKQENKIILQSSEAIDKELCENMSEVTIKENIKEGTFSSTNHKEEELASLENRKENDEPISKPSAVKIVEELINETSLKDEIKMDEDLKIKTSLKDEVKVVEELINETAPKDEVKIVEKLINETSPKDEVKVVEELINETSLKDEVKIVEELVNETSPKDEVKSDFDEPSVSVNLQKQSLCSYIKTITGVKHMIYSDIIINEILCVSVFSFNYLFSSKGKMKCLVCEEEVSDCDGHINQFKHITLLNDIPVIVNEASEFVREIKPELLHCGFCNMTVVSWSEMQDHFNSSSHKEIKNASEWRMSLYSTEVGVQNHHGIYSEFSELIVRNMFNGLLK